ncbi:hypothetical protein [Streptomyces sp. NPDC015130]|uniref:hypothetical protein n=1 Tax=Streptomyces sp. NPDC015130 TaxID=3364940 RepID=UPI0036F845A0
MTTHPTTTAAAAADHALAERATSHGEYLAGLINAAELHVVGQPEKLPELLFPDLDPAVVDRVWKQALAVGYRLGRIVDQPQWDAAGLRRLKAALADAGYAAMATQTSRTLATVHPADTDPARQHP